MLKNFEKDFLIKFCTNNQFLNFTQKLVKNDLVIRNFLNLISKV